MKVFASDFASLADLSAFRAAKSQGLSDQEAFRYGDNGIGCWGDTTATESAALCALPPEDWLARWGSAAAARGQLVQVKDLLTGQAILCTLADTMPHKADITNGCGIDLNPGALKALGLHSPIKRPVEWTWAADLAQPPTNWLTTFLARLRALT